jgi:hypothetical protein
MYEAWTKADTEKMNQIEVLKSENKRLREALDQIARDARCGDFGSVCSMAEESLAPKKEGES